MKPSLRESIKDKLRQHGPRFNLNAEQLIMQTFELQYKNDVSSGAWVWT